jgi:hypothetical protein
MAEQIDLDNPVPPTTPPVTDYRVKSVLMDVDGVGVNITEPGLLAITLKDNNGHVTSYQYTGNTAIEMIKHLNTANMTVKSMQKRILEQLKRDGFIGSGTVSGTPEKPQVPVPDEE